MPERPDLDYALPILSESLQSASIVDVQLHKPVILRLALQGNLEDALKGREIRGLTRHLHFVCFDFGPDSPVEMIIAPMLAGNLSVHEPALGKKRSILNADTR